MIIAIDSHDGSLSLQTNPAYGDLQSIRNKGSVTSRLRKQGNKAVDSTCHHHVTFKHHYYSQYGPG